MKRLAILFFLVFSYAINAQDLCYITKTNLFDGKGNELILSTNNRINSKNVTKGNVYSMNKGNRKNYLFINGATIKDNKLTIIDISKVPGGFYGWEIRIEDININNADGLIFQYWGEAGDRTTDPIILRWNSKSDNFSLVKIDPSEY
jgi:hypothetical protein